MTSFIAHRGCSLLYPENSMAAFRRAQECGADYLEVDLRRSREGRIFCFHDSTLTRTTGRKGRFAETDSESIEKLTLFGCEPLLGFEGFLKEFGSRIGLVLDIKSKGIEADIIELVTKYGDDSQVVYSSFDSAIVNRIKLLKPNSRTALIVGPVRNLRPRFNLTEFLLGRLRELNCDAIHLSKSLAGEKIIGKFLNAGLAVSVWTVDDAKRARRYIDLGVDGIITNTPETLIPQLAAHCRESRIATSHLPR